jgi:hypothetical protein
LSIGGLSIERSALYFSSYCLADNRQPELTRGALLKSFDHSAGSRLRTNGKLLIPFVVSSSNHGRNQIIQNIPNPNLANVPSTGFEQPVRDRRVDLSQVIAH